jgi:hypothetical protein
MMRIASSAFRDCFVASTILARIFFHRDPAMDFNAR